MYATARRLQELTRRSGTLYTFRNAQNQRRQMADGNPEFEVDTRGRYCYSHALFHFIEGSCEKGISESPRTRKQSQKGGIKLSKIHWINAVTG